MRTRTKGVLLADDGGRIVNKEYKGKRIFQRLGKVSQDSAEAWLRQQQADIDAERANSLRRGHERLWADAAQKYLKECAQRKVASLGMISRHVADLLPYIGALAMEDVCNDVLENFKLDRMEGDDDGKKPVKNATINRTLEVVRTTLIRAARVWREDGKPEKREKVFAQDVSFTRNQQEVLRLTARMNKVKLSELVRSIVDAWIRGRPSSYQPEQERASLSNPLTSLPPRRP